MGGPRMNSPVLIVSAFGRGHALAIALANQEIPVAVLDVSPHLGHVSAEDDEGPFGFFAQGLEHLESQRLLEDHPPLLQVQGFSWMLPTGPFETKGPLTQFRREKLKIPDSIWNLLTVKGPETHREMQYLLNEDFDQTWLYHLSRAFHSNLWTPNYRAGLSEGSLPFGSDFFIRSMSRAGIQKSFDALTRAQVTVRPGALIVDAARGTGNRLKSLEVKFEGSDTAELFEAEQFLWFLSGEETEKLSDRLRQKIFDSEVVRPTGAWIRARLKFPNVSQRESIPLHSVWIKDIALPWSHENLFALIRTSNPELFDVWLRIPEVYRFQKDYVLRMVEQIRQQLEDRMAFRGLQVMELPVTVVKSPQEVGPTRHPLFDERDVADLTMPSWKNFHWVGVEACLGSGWNYMFMRSREVGNTVQAWWKQRELEAKKVNKAAASDHESAER